MQNLHLIPTHQILFGHYTDSNFFEYFPIEYYLDHVRILLSFFAEITSFILTYYFRFRYNTICIMNGNQLSSVSLKLSVENDIISAYLIDDCKKTYRCLLVTGRQIPHPMPERPYTAEIIADRYDGYLRDLICFSQSAIHT